MKKSIHFFSSVLIIILITTQLSFSQAVICLGDDITVCAGSPVQINNCGTPGGGGPGGSTSILLNAPTNVNLSDDSWSGAINIGFTFNFYGANYTQCLIGSNGLLSFNLASANGYCAYSLTGVGPMPSAGYATARNTAMMCHQDINPGAGGSIVYQTIGTAPNRRFVVLYQNIPLFGSTACNYMSVILNETSNKIDYYIGNKPAPSTWNGGLAIQGAENNPGNVAHITPGRNNSQWAAVNDGKTMTPTTPANTSAYTIADVPYVLVYTGNQQWTNTLGQNFPYNSGTLNIPSASNGTVGYFLTATTVSVCAGGAIGATSDTSWVTGVNSSVTASMTPDICSSGVGTVTANPGAGQSPFSYLWPTLGNATTQTVNGVFAGTYQVQMTDGMGCMSTANVTVGDTPAAYSSSSTLVSCPGGSDGTATASMVPPLGNITYQWDDPAMQTTQTAVGLSAGTYNCTITSDVGCSNVVPVTVTEIPGMVANFTTITNVTCNSSNNGILTINVVDGTGPYTYSWDNSTSTASTANDLYAGFHTVTITDNNGCVITASETITEPSALVISNITPDTQICPEDDIMLTVAGSGGSSAYIFTWFEGSTMIGTGTSITVDPNVTGTQYCVDLTEVCGSPKDTRCVTITFPTPIVPSLLANQPEDCVVGEFEFINNSANKEEIASTYYDFGDNSSTIELDYDSTSHDYLKVGTYSIYMVTTSIYGCVYEDTIKDIVRVVPNPTAHFFFSDNPASVFETTILAYDKSTPDVVDWQWSSPGSVPSSSSLENPTFVFPDGQEGTYEVTLIVTSYYGCTDTLTHILSVMDDLLFYAPNSFTPDGDEFNQTWKLYLRGADVSDFNVQIYNRWGEIVWESYDPYIGWDGTYNGKLVQASQYVWKATMKNLKDDGKVEFNGNINLLK